jgi:hypothetical protein
MGGVVLPGNLAGDTTGALPRGETTQHPCRLLPGDPLIEVMAHLPVRQTR